MPPKCYTKTANDGHSYTHCMDEKKTKPKPKFKINKRTHTMADGTVMSGTTHTAESKPVVKKKPKFKINKRTPAPAPAPVVKKKKIVIRKQEGPRNLKKGFGIRSGAPTVQAPAKAAPSQLSKMTGLSRADANKMDPAKLFGMLPTELRKTVLTSGTKVGDVAKVPRTEAKNYAKELEAHIAYNKQIGLNTPFDESGHKRSKVNNEEDGIKNMKNAINRYLKSIGKKQIKDIQKKQVESIITNSVQNGVDRAELNKIVRKYQKNIDKFLYYKSKKPSWER